MPLYEYECAACGRFTKWQPYTEEALRLCPQCGRPVHKVFSVAAIYWRGKALLEELDREAERDARHPVRRNG